MAGGGANRRAGGRHARPAGAPGHRGEPGHEDLPRRRPAPGLADRAARRDRSVPARRRAEPPTTATAAEDAAATTTLLSGADPLAAERAWAWLARPDGSAGPARVARPAPAGDGERWRALGAALVLLAIVGGVPAVLLRLVGPPVPGGLGAADLVAVLSLVVWLAWAHFVGCVVAEWRGWPADATRRVPFGDRPRALARGLVAATLLASGAAVLAGPAATTDADAPSLAVAPVAPMGQIPVDGGDRRGLSGAWASEDAAVMAGATDAAGRREIAGTSLLAAGLLAALAARSPRARSRRLSRARDELRLAADVDAAVFLDRATRLLSAWLSAQGRPLPPVYAATLADDALVLHMAPAPSEPPPGTWHRGGAPGTWRIERSAGSPDTPAGLDPALLVDTPAPFPGLATVGHDDGGAWILVDVEGAPGPIAIEGSPRLAREIAVSIAVELATNQWSDDLRVYLVGFADDPSPIAPGRLRAVSTVGEVLDELAVREDWRTRSGTVGDAWNPAEAGRVLRGRQQARTRALWAPDLLVLASPPDEADAARLARYARGRDRAVGVLVAGGTAAARWVFTAGEGGQLSLGVLGLEVTARRLPATEYATVIELFRSLDDPLGGPPDAADAPTPSPGRLPAAIPPGGPARTGFSPPTGANPPPTGTGPRTFPGTFLPVIPEPLPPAVPARRPPGGPVAPSPGRHEADPRTPPGAAAGTQPSSDRPAEPPPTRFPAPGPPSGGRPLSVLVPIARDTTPPPGGGQPPRSPAPPEPPRPGPAPTGPVSPIQLPYAMPAVPPAEAQRPPETQRPTAPPAGAQPPTKTQRPTETQRPTDAQNPANAQHRPATQQPTGRVPATGHVPTPRHVSPDAPPVAGSGTRTGAERPTGGAGDRVDGAAGPAGPPDEADPGAVEARILGRPTVSAPGPVAVDQIEALTELVVYLALHPDGVSTRALAAALWPQGMSEQGVADAIGHARGWLGADPTGRPRLSADADGRLRLGPDVGCDWTRFHAHACQAQAATTGDGDRPPARAAEELAAALRLVTGPVAEDLPAGRYGWLHSIGIATHVRSAVVDVAHRLATLSLRSGDTVTAMAACRTGLRAVPAAEVLWRDLLRTVATRGDRNTLTAVATEMYRALPPATVPRPGARPSGRRHSGPAAEPETTALVQALLPGYRHRDRR
ncbi:BTAD domain-containing putative transcriptional regulator [Frankia nepalensis]|uniref:BTAD domain-containing putative transcriptional regulator n=1 Tax=Frankia nepalensis TaxID=1836974 RepID=UPI0027DBEFA6|nr:BTAD domain-containing putative transcriptional regulator [Frankia nepalensis]